MMFRGSSFAPSFSRASPLFSFFTKIPLHLKFQNNLRNIRHSFIHYENCNLFPKSVCNIQAYRFPMERVSRFCSITLSATPLDHRSSAFVSDNRISNNARKKARRDSPEGVLRSKLDMCSKHCNVVEALRLYDEARSKGIELNQHHYNVLLYLCSSGSSVESSDDDVKASNLQLKRGFEIFQQMIISKVSPNEATFTNVARLAVAMDDPEMAFYLVKQMKDSGIPPRLRSYGPALFGFCEKGMADRAYEVDADMAENGVIPEEPELSALLKLSADVKREDKVYELLHRLRATVRQVTESTFEIIEGWFNSEDASKIGEVKWDVSKVKEGIIRGGGGWHGQGWLGSGQWNVVKTQINEKGVCNSCGEKLVCIDIDPSETENFATSLTNLACKREVKSDFVRFQEWLQQHGPFDAVIDGANIGLVTQKEFNFYQLNTVVSKLRQLSPSKRLPLIILHRSRVNGGPAQKPNNKKLLEFWKNSGALYATPSGSNDDWYWLYAAVSYNCLLVTNDEMRDHLFQLLGTSFFPRWKEKHQVRLSVSRSGISLRMPPPYSIVIQESENGGWHVPTISGDDLETPRQWLCATRARNNLHPL
ncbi:proteinaceous RNase P 1, chloroplastic/mitochondrial [Mercurialis annua]|uniref:proteinaceous RNase P 1, chloroplastic/mitochondrial n=1 Tax=Mercurialis annua TaxID=3986 RepID=UPI00215FCBF9|nr:proteinaceous RNase P 1, chloroplastic/mitochondrial [Mercurialis annua]XP_050237206.1 proteinaceous RNase P 1, chloroplastic/mitochondrial [Mercurialis annua]